MHPAVVQDQVQQEQRVLLRPGATENGGLVLRLLPQARSGGHVRTSRQASATSRVRLSSELCTRTRRASCSCRRNAPTSLYSLENL
ncbi:hypothetical protein EYF80_048926 [Liparis tanakae]|uniref:Uncharacterized protein n=1 Tax=Liparis tanakae TaxID=230148 RepID=A0A4Z2FIC6_9TELE|nr:hypothetical protein EYF80_048926 [Liparis tanakae]